MKFNGPFGIWLRERRKVLDLTQFDLADQVGCSVVTVRKIEARLRRPSKAFAERLSDVLAIPSEDRAEFLTFARQVETTTPATESAVVTHNLPPQPTPFIGRNDELTLISTRLNNPACRLLTLVGAGGVGKTRLALEAARQHIDRFADGVYFVPLVSVTSPDLIAPSIASAVNLTFYGAEDPNVQVIGFLQEKDMLLVLDNFEQLQAGAGLLTEILANCGRVKIIVTSRERLNLQEEWAVGIDGLPFPEVSTVNPIETYPAVQLFVQRAQQVQANFSLADHAPSIITICQSAEGVPLAIELAVTWLRVLDCEQVAQQMAAPLDFLVTPLRNIPERHRQMRSVFDHSWGLLSEAEKSVLSKLSIFRGGFDLRAAETICGANLSLLTGLLDKSLVRMAEHGRYDLHELLRQYASDKLRDSGEKTAAERRHIDYFTELIEQASHHIFSPDETAWLDRLEIEHNNLRAAMEWALEGGQLELGLRLVAQMGWFWRKQFYRTEGRLWLDKFLARSSPPSPSWVSAIYFSGVLNSDLGDTDRALILIKQALAAAKSIGDKSNAARCLVILGHVLKTTGFVNDAAVVGEEGLALYWELGDDGGIHHALYILTRAMLGQHNAERAGLLMEEALDLARRAGATTSIAGDLALLGNIAFQQNNPERAQSLLKESLSAGREVRDLYGMSEAFLGLGSVARARKDYPRARRFYEESLAICEVGYPPGAAEAHWGLGAVAREEGDVEQAHRHFTEGLILNKGLDEWDTAYCLAGLGGLAAIKKESQRAARLLGIAGFLFKNNRDIYPADAILFDRDVAIVRAQLGDSAFATAWAEGQALTVDEATDYALTASDVDLAEL